MADSKKDPVFIPLEGVESEHCALIVDKALQEVAGVESHKVELNNRRAVITGATTEMINEAVQKIRGYGYGVTTLKKTFPVLQMTCASCAISVESMLKSKPGVLSAAVNFANASVMVEYIPGIVEPQDLKQTIQSIGYDLVIDETQGSADSLENLKQKQYQHLKRKTLGAVLFSLPVVIIGMFFMDMPYAN